MLYVIPLLGRSPDSLRKDMEAIAAELKQDNLQQTVLESDRGRDVVDRLLSSPSLVNHPAITAAAAITTASANSWR